ncbi:hypothetical protein NEOLEDRAFT_1155278 [Neolentinus lepideus HHB14362 ss-1]|uniref:Protein-lysine N-methyltransferase EFM6 n=1 Tax=Neolentinus lepideus HHB14362 ss-1 TaxID=1314782 RepID=A0A165TMI7_9AGAM|nr:hypothetical protein NEOLEDRAFT_1155278 [Neolentinus lepideus HHB14362 ss-1]
MKMEEELDFADPLRHLCKTDESQSEILPPQPVSVQNQIVQLSFTCGSPEEQIQILLKVDASPGCGGLAWPAGEVLAAYLALRGRKSLSGKTILELGSGTGLVGLVAGALGGNAWITDQLPLLEIMKANVVMNDLASCVEVAELNWGKPIPDTLPRSPDLIITADCVYFEPAFPLLVETLDELVSNARTEVLFCYKKRRKADKRFFTLLRKRFTWEEVQDDPNTPVYSREAISLLRLFKKS